MKCQVLLLSKELPAVKLTIPASMTSADRRLCAFFRGTVTCCMFYCLELGNKGNIPSKWTKVLDSYRSWPSLFFEMLDLLCCPCVVLSLSWFARQEPFKFRTESYNFEYGLYAFLPVFFSSSFVDSAARRKPHGPEVLDGTVDSLGTAAQKTSGITRNIDHRLTLRVDNHPNCILPINHKTW